MPTSTIGLVKVFPPGHLCSGKKKSGTIVPDFLSNTNRYLALE